MSNVNFELKEPVFVTLIHLTYFKNKFLRINVLMWMNDKYIYLIRSSSTSIKTSSSSSTLPRRTKSTSNTCPTPSTPQPVKKVSLGGYAFGSSTQRFTSPVLSYTEGNVSRESLTGILYNLILYKYENIMKFYRCKFWFLNNTTFFLNVHVHVQFWRFFNS